MSHKSQLFFNQTIFGLDTELSAFIVLWCFSKEYTSSTKVQQYSYTKLNPNIVPICTYIYLKKIICAVPFFEFLKLTFGSIQSSVMCVSQILRSDLYNMHCIWGLYAFSLWYEGQSESIVRHGSSKFFFCKLIDLDQKGGRLGS